MIVVLVELTSLLAHQRSIKLCKKMFFLFLFIHRFHHFLIVDPSSGLDLMLKRPDHSEACSDPCPEIDGYVSRLLIFWDVLIEIMKRLLEKLHF